MGNASEVIPDRIITNQQCQSWFDQSGRTKVIREGFLCAGFKDGVMDSCEVSIAGGRERAEERRTDVLQNSGLGDESFNGAHRHYFTP